MISTAELERTLEYLRAIYPERQAELEPLSERCLLYTSRCV